MTKNRVASDRSMRTPRTPAPCLIGIIALVFFLPSSAVAQIDSAPFHFSLQSWVDDIWFNIEDRNGNVGGRLGREGQLARFADILDAEFGVDRISMAFSATQDWRWRQAKQGARYLAGSINMRDLVAAGDVKAVVPLSGSWQFRAAVYEREGPGRNHHYMRLRFQREVPELPIFAYAEGNFPRIKPDMDVTVGGGWKSDKADVQVAFTLLDTFSDAIYQGLGVWSGWADSAFDYENVPLAMRMRTRVQPVSRLFFEFHTGRVFPNTLRIYRQVAPDTGFRQKESLYYAGGLLEWQFSPSLHVAAFANTVRAMTDRTQLPSGDPLDVFGLNERTDQIGLMARYVLNPRWIFHAWIMELRQYHERVSLTNASLAIDYEDSAFDGQFEVGYRSSSGFVGNIAFEWDHRDVLRGEREIPSTESIGQHHSRIRMDLGWRFGSRASFVGGYRIDYDGDPGTQKGWYDGAHARFTAYW